jgi:hypothetical protein
VIIYDLLITSPYIPIFIRDAVAYPAIDVIDGATGDLIKADNVVGAFDWSLQFRWEVILLLLVMHYALHSIVMILLLLE